MWEKQQRRQYLATIILNLISLVHGAAVGWTSPALLILQSPTETVLPSGPIDMEESAWTATILCFGGFMGTLTMGMVVDKIGRKKCLIINSFPHLICFMTIIFAQNVYHIYIARFLAGFGGGSVFAVHPIFIAEIADDKIRGTLGSLMVLSCNLGILLMFVAGYLFSYYIYTSIFMTLSVVYFIGLMFLPETPKYLMKINQLEEAERSFRFYQNIPSQSHIQLNTVHKIESEYSSVIEDNQLKPTAKDFCSKVARKGFLIGFALTWLNQFCGLYAMLNYTATIFQDAGSSLSPNLSAIIIALIQLIGCYVSTLLVDRFGRKILLSVSAMGIGIGLFCLGSFMFLKAELGYDLNDYSWVSIVCFSASIFVGNIGVMNLPFVVISEIFPEKIKSIANTICMLLLWSQSFFVVKYFGSISQVVGMHYCFFFFSICSVIGATFIMLCVPETKGKSFDEILKILES